MIHFPRLRTPRLDVQLRELRIGEAVQLASIPPNRHERAISALLRFAIEEAAGPHADPAAWTVQERMLVMAHYISSVSETGANFELGDARYLDFLDPAVDTAPEEVDAGTACGDTWRIRQLHGAEAEAIEAQSATRFDWLLGDIAARLRVQSEDEPPVPDPIRAPHQYAEWLRAQVDTMKEMPESEFTEVYVLYRLGLQKLHHLFRLEIADSGHMVLQKKRKEGGGEFAPARFPVAACITDIASILGEGDAGPRDPS